MVNWLTHWFSKYKKFGRPNPEKGKLDPDQKFANLTEVLDYLEANVSKEEQRTFIGTDPGLYHFGIGMWMRNNWGLWDKESDLHKWFASHGITHADDMSGIILTSFRRRLLGQPIGFEQQVENYKSYWRQMEDVRASGKTVYRN